MPAQVFNSATGSETNSTTSANMAKSGKVPNSHSGQTYQPNTQGGAAGAATAVNTSSLTSNLTATATTSTPASNLNTSSIPMHATRGACHASAATNNAATANTAASVNHTVMANNSSNTNNDEKIGTRRSVRASAAANKMIYTRGIHNNNANANNNLSNNDSAGKIVGKNNATNSSTDSVAEARRKTRSAGNKMFPFHQKVA